MSLGRFGIHCSGMDVGELNTVRHRAESFVGSGFPTSAQNLASIYLFIFKLNVFLHKLNVLALHILPFMPFIDHFSQTQFNED